MILFNMWLEAWSWQLFPTHVSGQRPCSVCESRRKLPRRRRKNLHRSVVQENSLRNCYKFILCLSESSPPHVVYCSLEFSNRWVMDQNYINYLLFTINICYLLFIIPMFIKFAFFANYKNVWWLQGHKLLFRWLNSNSKKAKKYF